MRVDGPEAITISIPPSEAVAQAVSVPDRTAAAPSARTGWLSVLRQELTEDLRYALAHIPATLGRRLRAAYYGRALEHLGRRAVIGEGVELIAPERISIGDDFIALRGCFLCAAGGGRITIGDRVSLTTNAMLNAGEEGVIIIGDDSGIGNNCVLRTSAHRYQDPSRPFKSQGTVPGRIIVEEDVWVAANCTLLPGTHLERGCIVGSGSVVGGRVKAYSIIAGNPARVVGRRGE